MAELVVIGFDDATDADRVLTKLSGFKGHLIRSSLSPKQEAKLRTALSQAHLPGLSAGAAGTTARAVRQRRST